jgi:hypothetical protein
MCVQLQLSRGLINRSSRQSPPVDGITNNIRGFSENGDTIAEVNFRKMTVTGSRVFLGDLVRIATEVLGYRFPVDTTVSENLA